MGLLIRLSDKEGENTLLKLIDYSHISDWG